MALMSARYGSVRIYGGGAADSGYLVDLARMHALTGRRACQRIYLALQSLITFIMSPLWTRSACLELRSTDCHRIAAAGPHPSAGARYF